MKKPKTADIKESRKLLNQSPGFWTKNLYLDYYTKESHLTRRTYNDYLQYCGLDSDVQFKYSLDACNSYTSFDAKQRDTISTIFINKPLGSVIYQIKGTNRIFDNRKSKKLFISYPFHHYYDARMNESIEDINDFREYQYAHLEEEIQPNKLINVINSSEGLGKNLFIPKFLDLYKTDRVIVLFQSHIQLKDKEILLKKIYPHLKDEIYHYKGNDHILDELGIDKKNREFREENNVKFVDIKKTLDSDILTNEQKKLIHQELNYQTKIARRELKGLPKIILMTTKKLQAEVMYKKYFTNKNEVFIHDEYIRDFWSQVEPNKKFIEDNEINIETWKNFKVQLRKKYDYKWKSSLKGKHVVLTTEIEPSLYFENKYKNRSNIINLKTSFFTDNKKSWYYSEPVKNLNSKNRKHYANLYRKLGYEVWGDSTGGDLNNITIKGRNFNSLGKIVYFSSIPHPHDTAIFKYMTNIRDTKLAECIIMADKINQNTFGRIEGYRKNIVPYEEMHVLIPESHINDVLQYLRYLTNIERNNTSLYMNKKEKKNFITKEVNKIRHTFSCSINKSKIKKIDDNLLLNLSILKTIHSSNQKFISVIIDKDRKELRWNKRKKIIEISKKKLIDFLNILKFPNVFSITYYSDFVNNIRIPINIVNF